MRTSGPPPARIYEPARDIACGACRDIADRRVTIEAPPSRPARSAFRQAGCWLKIWSRGNSRQFAADSAPLRSGGTRIGHHRQAMVEILAEAAGRRSPLRGVAGGRGNDSARHMDLGAMLARALEGSDRPARHGSCILSLAAATVADLDRRNRRAATPLRLFHRAGLALSASPVGLIRSRTVRVHALRRRSQPRDDDDSGPSERLEARQRADSRQFLARTGEAHTSRMPDCWHWTPNPCVWPQLCSCRASARQDARASARVLQFLNAPFQSPRSPMRRVDPLRISRST